MFTVYRPFCETEYAIYRDFRLSFLHLVCEKGCRKAGDTHDDAINACDETVMKRFDTTTVLESEQRSVLFPSKGVNQQSATKQPYSDTDTDLHHPEPDDQALVVLLPVIDIGHRQTTCRGDTGRDQEAYAGRHRSKGRRTGQPSVDIAEHTDDERSDSADDVRLVEDVVITEQVGDVSGAADSDHYRELLRPEGLTVPQTTESGEQGDRDEQPGIRKRLPPPRPVRFTETGYGSSSEGFLGFAEGTRGSIGEGKRPVPWSRSVHTDEGTHNGNGSVDVGGVIASSSVRVDDVVDVRSDGNTETLQTVSV